MGLEETAWKIYFAYSNTCENIANKLQTKFNTSKYNILQKTYYVSSAGFALQGITGTKTALLISLYAALKGTYVSEKSKQEFQTRLDEDSRLKNIYILQTPLLLGFAATNTLFGTLGLMTSLATKDPEFISNSIGVLGSGLAWLTLSGAECLHVKKSYTDNL